MGLGTALSFLDVPSPKFGESILWIPMNSLVLTPGILKLQLLSQQNHFGSHSLEI